MSGAGALAYTGIARTGIARTGVTAIIDPSTFIDITVTVTLDPQRWGGNLEPARRAASLDAQSTPTAVLDSPRHSAKLDPPRWEGQLT